jgi:hypothetical protein
LTLIAKTLQNLANLVTFGQKEPFMADMNPFIEQRIPDMRRFLERASVGRPPQSETFTPHTQTLRHAHECHSRGGRLAGGDFGKGPAALEEHG